MCVADYFDFNVVAFFHKLKTPRTFRANTMPPTSMKPQKDPTQIRTAGEAALGAFLQNFPILRVEEKQLIIDNADIREFKKGAVLLREGQTATQCYLVLKGCVRAYYVVDGEERSTDFYTEGYSVNSFTSAAQGTPSRHYLVCAEDCLLTVSNDAMEAEMCRLIPRLESIIRQEVQKNTGLMQDAIARFLTSSPEERYLHLLNTRSDLFNRIPQHQLASYIGIKPESFSRLRRRVHVTRTS